jgi:ribonuclease HIII
LKSNEVFKVPLDKYQNIKQDICKKFKINPKQNSSNSIVELFEIMTKEGKITFTLYKTNKLMVQSSTNNQDFQKIVKVISDSLSANAKTQSNILSPLE